MAEEKDIQSSFINWIKEKSNPNVSFVDEIAELLNISRDSAYRRLRGETLLTFDEISKISTHYKVSLDTFLHLKTNSVVFTNRNINDEFDYRNYLVSILDNLKMLNRCHTKKMVYTAKDIPPLHYFQFPVLTAFKSFFWQRTILSKQEFQDLKFDPEIKDMEILQITKAIWDQYLKIPSLEIWTDETINITLRQIEYYFDIDVITKDQATVVIDEYLKLIQHLRVEARVGKKLYYERPESGLASFELYHNEIAIGDNTIYFILDDKRMVFLTYNMLNTLNTMDEVFCAETEKYMNNILQKSTPISVASEKERNRFFNRMVTKIESLKNKIQEE